VEPLEILKRRIDERKSSIALFMTSGGCKSMEDYTRMVGKGEMLEALLQDISEIEKRYVDD
jgi:hypothetical protein